jgi:hypothetical protein
MLFRHFLDIFLFENDLSLSLGRVFVLVLAASTRVHQLPDADSLLACSGHLNQGPALFKLSCWHYLSVQQRRWVCWLLLGYHDRGSNHPHTFLALLLCTILCCPTLLEVINPED